MKKILLSSAAIVAFAGAATADIEWSGSASLGYNEEAEDGFYQDADIDLTATTELDNGWTASLTYGFELEENNDDFSADNDILISLTNGVHGIFYGDTEYAAVEIWDGVSEMAQDNFSEKDDEEVLKFTSNYAGIEFAYSIALDSNDADGQAAGGNDNNTGQQSFGIKYTFGNWDVGFAYQEEADFAPLGADFDDNGTPTDPSDDINGDFVFNEVYGLSANTSWAGIDITAAYAQTVGIGAQDDEDSFGVEVSYPVGDWTLEGFYVQESVSSEGDDNTYGLAATYAAGAIEAKIFAEQVQGVGEYGIGGNYDFDNGLVLAAGYISGDSDTDNDYAGYVAADYDLGGGASVIVSYTEQENTDDGIDLDDIDSVLGNYELNDGFTVILDLDF